MFSRDSIKVNEDIKKVKFRNNFVPKVVIDYLLLLLMMEFEDVYTISTFIVALWYRSTYKEHRSICSELRNAGIGGGNDEANFQYDLSEFDVCEQEADKPCKNFIFPFSMKIIGF
jgi:hypothetical protein